MSSLPTRARRDAGRAGTSWRSLRDLLPRAARPHLEQALRDAGMVLRGLQGRGPAPLVQRPPRRDGAPQRTALTARGVRIARVVRETPDAVSLYLDDPTGGLDSFTPGQFLTVMVDVGGQTLRRAYSLASPALPGEAPHVTVKRIPEGRVSGWLNERAQAGQVLRVLGPSGSFTVEPDPATERHLVMLAGGSGITPIMSIAHTVLAVEPRSRVTLIYGNRRERDIIFRERIEALAREHGDRFRVDHVLSDPPEGWRGPAGLLDEATVDARIEALGVASDPALRYFVCGPTPMMESVRAALTARGVPAERIHEERFVRPEERRGPGRLPTEPQPVRIGIGGEDREVLVRPGQTVLEAGLAAALPMPFSCAMGGCGACRVRLEEGEVDMEEPNCLTGEERARGYVLACVSRPCGAARVRVES
ncbi:MAG: 2Fe-2S iron-sulfur cluster-binding protein [Myxococcota bacterium]